MSRSEKNICVFFFKYTTMYWYCNKNINVNVYMYTENGNKVVVVDVVVVLRVAKYTIDTQI